MNEYNEHPENKDSPKIKNDRDISQEESKPGSFEPILDTELLDDSNLKEFVPNTKLKYEDITEFTPTFQCWPDEQKQETERRIKLEKLVEQLRKGDRILDGGELVQQAREIVEKEKLEKEIRNGKISFNGGMQETSEYTSSEKLTENTKNLENKSQENVEKSINIEKQHVGNEDFTRGSSRESDSKSILEKIANVQTRALVDKEHLGSIIKALKHEKRLSQQKISDKIGFDIRSAISRGGSIPIENFNKLKELANSVNLNLKYEEIIQKNVYDIKSMQKLAAIVGALKTGKPGKCLSETYQAMNKTLKWKCGACGKEWEAHPNGIVYKQNWCSRCSGKESWGYSQMVALAKERGLEKTGFEGKFLTPKESFKDQKFPDRLKYMWKCGKCETEFEAIANNVKHGSWCRVCQYDKLSEIFREPYENIQKLAEKIGKIKTGYPGELLADKDYYESVNLPSAHKFSWRCGKCEGDFQMDITHVKRPQWCPTCTEGESERICRGYFERIFNAPFPKIRPEWLINPETNSTMELDGYNENLQIAFEFNGPQHYMFYPKYHKHFDDFKRRQESDYLKEITCKENGVTLISVPHTLDYDEFQDFIQKEYEKMTGKDLGDIPKYNWRDFSTEQRTITDFFD